VVGVLLNYFISPQEIPVLFGGVARVCDMSVCASIAIARPEHTGKQQQGISLRGNEIV